MTVNAAVSVPLLPSVTVRLAIVSRGRSSLTMVTTAWASAMVALTGDVRLTKNVSFGLDGRIADDRDGDGGRVVVPGAKVAVPDAAV